MTNRILDTRRDIRTEIASILDQAAESLQSVGFVSNYERHERASRNESINSTGDIHGFYEITMNHDSSRHPGGLTLHVQGYTDPELSNEQGIFFRGRLRDTAAMLAQRKRGASVGNEHDANIAEFELTKTIRYHADPHDMVNILGVAMLEAYQHFTREYARQKREPQARKTA